MALPPLPENNTDRLFIRYQTGGGASSQEHTMSIRFDSAAISAFQVMEDLAETVFNVSNIAAVFDGWRVLDAEVQEAGALIRLPVTVPLSLLGFVGTGQELASAPEQAREIRFIGRGNVSGRKVSVSLYGVANTQYAESDFRFTPGPTTFLGDFLAAATLFSINGLAFLTIAGDRATWYNYVNWQYNSHWESEQRA